jgi:hypothetical protein
VASSRDWRSLGTGGLGNLRSRSSNDSGVWFDFDRFSGCIQRVPVFQQMSPYASARPSRTPLTSRKSSESVTAGFVSCWVALGRCAHPPAASFVT